jgi:hypothetical protein
MDRATVDNFPIEDIDHMKRFLVALVLMGAAVPVFAANVGVSIEVGQPGFYGRIDIGGAPPPRLIYREPKIVGRVVVSEPLYLYVPPQHARNWSKHCHEYNACGRRVFFVQDRWYKEVYVPHYRQHHAERERHEEREEHRRGNPHDRR